MPPNAPKIPERELKVISAWIESLGKDQKPSAPADMETSKAKEVTSTPPKFDGIVPVSPSPGPLSITAFAASRSVLAVSGLHQVLLFDLAAGDWKGALAFPEGDVFALKFTADGSRLIAAGGAGGSSGAVVLWNTATYQREQSIAIEDDVVLAMDITPDGQKVAVAGPKRSIELINLATGAREHVLKKHADWVTSLAFSPDGVLLASGDRFGGIYLWDVQNGQQFDIAEAHSGMITALHFSHDSNQLWSAGRDGNLKGWNLPNSTCDQRQQISDRGIADMQLVGDQIITVDNERRVCCSGRTGDVTVISQMPDDLTRNVVLKTDTSAQLVVGDCNSNLRWLNMKGEILREVSLPQKREPVSVVAIAPRVVERQLRSLNTTEATIATKDAHFQKSVRHVEQTLNELKSLLELSRHNLDAMESEIARLEEAVKELKAND